MCIYYNLIIIYIHIYNYKINSKVLWNFLLSLLSIVLIVLIVTIVIYSYCAFNISFSSLHSKNFPIPFVISQIYRNFAAFWSAARRASNPYMHHPAMATFPVASPPSR